MLTALHNLLLINGGTITRGKAVLVKEEKITGVVNENDIPAEAKRIDLHDCYLAPSFIDLQVYGSGGKLFGGKYLEDALQQMESDFIEQGTTGFLATIGTNTPEVFEQAILAAKSYGDHSKGNFLGLHLEGPFINPLRKGAHDEKLIRKATLAEVKRWVEMGEGVIKMMTLAPELQDSEVIDYLTESDVVIAAGHSNATYEDAKGFLNKSIPAVTHLYNAMPQMHHREPGFIPAIFEEKPYTSIVADGVHVDFAMVRLAKRELGDKLYLITDSVTNSSDGAYHHEFKGTHYVMQPHGTLSGSCLTMLRAVQNCVEHADINLAEAINMATLYPSQLMKLNKGRIAEGLDADLVAFDKDYQVRAVMLTGNLLTNRT